MSATAYIPFNSKANNTDLPSVICLGNFDGVHLGHKQLISSAVSYAKELREKGEEAGSGVFFFNTPPADILMDSPPPHITTLKEKLEIFASLGAEYAVICDFSSITKCAYKEQILKYDDGLDIDQQSQAYWEDLGIF